MKEHTRAGAGVFLAKLLVFFSSGDFGGGRCLALGWVKAGFPKGLSSAVLKQLWPIWPSTGPGESPLAPSAAWWRPPAAPICPQCPAPPSTPSAHSALGSWSCWLFVKRPALLPALLRLWVTVPTASPAAVPWADQCPWSSSLLLWASFRRNWTYSAARGQAGGMHTSDRGACCAPSGRVWEGAGSHGCNAGVRCPPWPGLHTC